ncbi:MAG: alpha/beta hydrolase [Alphaproteobacteria bacterium]|nr:alpha/beta hydrolase [Alphaproteobacteria bacterium]
MSELPPLDEGVLPSGVRSRFVDGINGLRMHVLEAGLEPHGRPLILLLHGFPELAYSWRKVMLPLAAAGFHVVAPDQRGYGRTTGWDADYDGDLASFRILNAVRDALGLVSALGYRKVAGVFGHDFGASVAAWCALVRPDVFRSVALMSAPFAGPPPLPFNTADDPAQSGPTGLTIHDDLAKLPRPRKHYQWYYSTRPANNDMWHCPQGVHAFLRGYFHHKSADWNGNNPFPLKSWTAGELAKMPTYYIMDLAQNMPETVAAEMPSEAQIAACRWLPDSELRVYSTEYERTGFQGGLQWYRSRTGGKFDGELQLFSGRTIDVPSIFIAGKSDWGTYQRPGNFEQMQQSACTRMMGCHLIDGAGHWVQQEQPEQVSTLLVEFLQRQ